MYNPTFPSDLSASYFWLVFDQWVSITVRKTVGEDHNKVNEPPHAATTRRQQLNYSCPSFACIETVHS